MHRITSCSQKVMLRFRRWSRKEYAAFVSLHRHVTIGQVGRGIADASLGKQKTAVCEGKKTEGTSWTDLSEEDALFGSGGPGLGGSLFETDRTELWRLLVPQREEVPALLLDEINKITIHPFFFRINTYGKITEIRREDKGRGHAYFGRGFVAARGSAF